MVTKKPAGKTKLNHVKLKSKPKRGGNRSKTSADMIDAVMRQTEALRLRQSGHTFAKIAAALGYSDPGCARDAVLAALRDNVTEPNAEMRALELARLDALHEALWEKALGGDLPAVDRVLKVMERRSKMLGLDAPPAKPTDGDLDEQIQREFDRINGLEDPADFGEAAAARTAAGRAETVH